MKKAIGIMLLSLMMLSGVALTARADNDDHEKHTKQVRDLGSAMEVQINEKGKVTVRGAKITAISGQTITAIQNWGSYIQTWTVVTGSSTEFVRKSGNRATSTEMKVNDFVSFTGNIDLTKSALTVNAKVVKNWSLQNAKILEKRTFEGTVQSIGGTGTTTATTTVGSAFVLKVGNTNYNVVVPSAISILNKDWRIIPLSSIQVGHKVRVYGAVRADNMSILEASVVRDTSI